jgi:ribosomal protein S20
VATGVGDVRNYNNKFCIFILKIKHGRKISRLEFTIMYSEAKKLHIIEEVLKINNDAALSALENFVKKYRKDEDIKKDSVIREFSGIWSKDEAEEMERIIAESCETIHPDNWK